MKVVAEVISHSNLPVEINLCDNNLTRNQIINNYKDDS